MRNGRIPLPCWVLIATSIVAAAPARADCPDPNSHPVPQDAKTVGGKTRIPCDCNAGFVPYGGRCVSRAAQKDMVQKDRWRKIFDRTCLDEHTRQAFQNWNWLLTEPDMTIEEGPDPGNDYHIGATPDGLIVSTTNYSSLDPDIVTFELGKALFISGKIATRKFDAWSSAHTSWIGRVKATPRRDQSRTNTLELGDPSGESASAFGYVFRAVYCGIPGGSEGNSIMRVTIPWLPPPRPPGNN